MGIFTEVSAEAHRLRRADVHPPAALLVPLHGAAAAPADARLGPLNVFHYADEVVVVVLLLLLLFLLLLRVAAGAGVGEVEPPPQWGAAVDGRRRRRIRGRRWRGRVAGADALRRVGAGGGAAHRRVAVGFALSP